ncbi:MAG: GNAT family N-acetyltransferase [Candidatus Njordarchaeia archaeon]
MALSIIEPSDPEEFHQIEEIQREAWGMRDIEIVPYRIMIAIHEAGGCVYIAYYNGETAGFVLGFPALRHGEVYLHSHQLGVKRKFWGKNIGYKLKLKQREFALSKGIKLVRWTYDPLLGRNAHLNFKKLGCINNTYLVNLYGEMKDEVNYGLPSDRFYVEWWLDSKRVRERIKGQFPPQVNEILAKGVEIINKVSYRDGIAKITDYETSSNDKVLLLELPYDIEGIKKKNLKVAIDWRYATREIFQSYFKRGYYAVEFLTQKMNGVKKNFYVLYREQKEKILEKNWWDEL